MYTHRNSLLSIKIRHGSYDQCRPFCCQETVQHYWALQSWTVCRQSSRLPAESSCQLPDVHGFRCEDQHKPSAKYRRIQLKIHGKICTIIVSNPNNQLHCILQKMTKHNYKYLMLDISAVQSPLLTLIIDRGQWNIR